MNSEGHPIEFSRNLANTVRGMNDLSRDLEEAIDVSDHEKIKTALDRGASPNHYHSHRRETLLMSACYNCDVESVKLLLEAQADPNLGISDKKRGVQVTPLMIAAENGMTDAVSELLNARANPHVRNSSGETALLAAARTNNHEAFAVLVGSMVSSTAT